MYCLKCNSEYREGIEVCPECGSPLSESLPEEEVNIEFDPNEKAVILYNAADEFEADVIIAKLRAEGIYAYKKLKGIDGYNKILFGRTVLGVNVIVGEKSLEEAKNIIETDSL